jgi:heat shock protein HtpX
MVNTTKIFLLMAALTGLFMIAGQTMGGQSGMIMALVMALGLNFFAYWFSDKMALKMSRAREIGSSEASELHSMVEQLAARAGLPKPRIYIIPGDTPNAFATGRNPEHAAVAVTEGLLRLLNREELEGVLAHELAHIKNRDILISSVAAVMAGAISYLATMAQWGMILGSGRSSDEEGGENVLGSLAIMIIAPIAALLIQMAISRNREYLADATGAKICGRSQGLASALKRLEEYNRQLPMQVNPATAQMYIVNPLNSQSLSRLFSTHPSTQERIKRLGGF